MTPFSQHVGSKQNEPPLNGNGGSSGSLGAGVLLSVGLHAALITFVIFGLPIFWQPDQLPGAIGIELAQLSDITAAPVPQVQGKPKEQPKPEPPKPVVEEKPKKVETPPPPAPPKPAAPPPPEPEEEVAEAIPDPQAEKLAEEKKVKEEKEKKEKEKKEKEKKEKEKKEKEKAQQKKDDLALASVLNDVLNQKPAPEPEKKPEKKPAAAAPSEPVTGDLTENASPVRLTAAQEDGYKRQLIPNWNFDAGIANPENYVVTVRIDLAPDGTVLKAEILDKARMSDPVFRSVAETARRAPLKLARFDLPRGEEAPPQIDIVFDLAKAINGSF